jgi:Uma2 family endonuclease
MTRLATIPTSASPEVDAPAPTLDAPLVLRLPDCLPMDEEQYFALCQENETLWIERNARGELVIMPPAAGDGGIKNAELNSQLSDWARQDGTGRVFDSSSGFRLPNGATRGPDAAWVVRGRLLALPPEERERFLPLCPDFVAELRSSTDRLSFLQHKMEEYMANGARLGWLLDPRHRQVHVYRPGVPMEQLHDPATLSGDPVLPGFVLDVARVFDATF